MLADGCLFQAVHFSSSYKLFRLNTLLVLILTYITKKGCDSFGKRKFANLGSEQINEIKSLEEKLEVTLIAYDLFSTEGPPQEDNNPTPINPS